MLGHVHLHFGKHLSSSVLRDLKSAVEVRLISKYQSMDVSIGDETGKLNATVENATYRSSDSEVAKSVANLGERLLS